MRIAWFTPFGPKSSIGHYSEEIVAGLVAGGDEVTLFVPGSAEHGPIRPTKWPHVMVPVDPPDDLLASLSDYDIAVYNLGNNLHFHLPIYQTAVRRPGIVILHDLVMRDFFRGYFLLHEKDPLGYARFLGYAHGPEAEAEGREIAEERMPEPHDGPARLRYPLFKPALHGAYGVIVHSNYSRQRIEPEIDVPVRTLDFPIHGPSTAYAQIAPKRSTTSTGPTRILTFGELNPNKLIHVTIEAIAGSDLLRRSVRFEVIGSGERSYEEALRERIRRHGLEGIVSLLGWRSDDDLRESLSTADVVVNLRNPHLGESSGSLLNSLVAGVATVVWDHGFYGEFPTDVVAKVSAESEVGPTLERLVRNPEQRLALGSRARAHALQRFDLPRYCRDFHAFAEDVLRTKPVLALADTVAALLVEFGSNEIDQLANRMAYVINDFTPQRSEPNSSA